MKTTEQIQEELEKHIEHRKEIYNNPNKQNDKKIHDIIIKTLEWVLKDGDKDDKRRMA